MMDKYIVEIDGNNICSDSDGKSKLALSVKADNGYAVFCTEIPLTPYTEPDLEQIKSDWYKAGREAERVRQPDLEQVRKEAYEQGYYIGYSKYLNKSYEDGLKDAWEAARTLWNTPNRKEIFGHTTFNTVLTTLTGQEVIEKIRAYEQAQKEIQVGDEVNAPFGKAIVVNIDSVAEKIWLVYADGHGGFEYFKDAPTKTGRHFPEIAEVLAKMKETDNG